MLSGWLRQAATESRWCRGSGHSLVIAVTLAAAVVLLLGSSLAPTAADCQAWIAHPAAVAKRSQQQHQNAEQLC